MSRYIIHRKLGGSVEARMIRGDIRVALTNYAEEQKRAAYVPADKPKWDEFIRWVNENTPRRIEEKVWDTPACGTVSVTRASRIGAWILRSNTPPSGSGDGSSTRGGDGLITR